MPTIQEIMTKKKEFQAELTEFGKAALSEEFKKVFDKHPELVAVRWTQFTPYFNDGDSCTFSAHGFTYRTNDTAEDAGDCEDGFEYASGYGDEPPISKAVAKLDKIDDEVYEAVFGDHCRVTATREGFEVEEYDHD